MSKPIFAIEDANGGELVILAGYNTTVVSRSGATFLDENGHSLLLDSSALEQILRNTIEQYIDSDVSRKSSKADPFGDYVSSSKGTSSNEAFDVTELLNLPRCTDDDKVMQAMTESALMFSRTLTTINTLTEMISNYRKTISRLKEKLGETAK